MAGPAYGLTDALDAVERINEEVNEKFRGARIDDTSAYMDARIAEYERLYAEEVASAPIPDEEAQALIDRAHGVIMDGTPLSGEKVFEEVRAMQCPECGAVWEKAWGEDVSYCTACGFCTHPRVEKKRHGFWTCQVCAGAVGLPGERPRGYSPDEEARINEYEMWGPRGRPF